MKLPLHLYPLVAMTLSTSTEGFGASFTGSSRSTFTKTFASKRSTTTCRQHLQTRGSMLMYDSRSDPPNKGASSSGDSGVDMWSALSTTERWISEIFAQGGQSGSPNPYARKEVSYVCETSDETSMIVGGIFRRLREVRELGENHGRGEEERIVEGGPHYTPATLRQTQVVVIPSGEELSSFPVFDNLIQKINDARRNSRDYLTDIRLEKLDEKLVGEEEERDWSVSVNCAHLHPQYGEKTPEEILAEMEHEEEEGEVDVNLKAYQERRLKARQSPHPTIIIEVRATPPPDFGDHSMPLRATKGEAKSGDEGGEDEKVSREDVEKLEALFGKPAAKQDRNEPKKEMNSEDMFYAKIGKSIDEITFVTPLTLAQNWVSQNDPFFDVDTSTFTVSDTKHVDSGYEFVFTNIAMHQSGFEKEDSGSNKVNRQYLVMSNFLTTSATSFEKFANEVSNIVSAIPSLVDNIELTTLHPENIDGERRSPVPVLVLQWKE